MELPGILPDCLIFLSIVKRLGKKEEWLRRMAGVFSLRDIH